MSSLLTDGEIVHFQQQGWLLVKDHLDVSLQQLQLEVDEIARWPDAGDWSHHYEMTDFGPRLARTENFTPFSPLMNSLLRDGTISLVATELLGEAALLYKEKINYKMAGGAGFAAHQDQPAYPFVDSVLSVMVAVDDSTRQNGCLFVSSGQHHRLLEQDERGCLSQEVVSELQWMAVPMLAGETLFFHALTPHRSGPNSSTRDRRALYPTYNGVSEGDLRENYYAAKRDAFAAAAPGDRVRLSLIGDFEGRPV